MNNDLRILTWNCGGALRKKWKRLESYHADVMVIQECEDPERSDDSAYKQWAGDYLWLGPTKNKGIGVFVKAGHTIASLPLPCAPLELFLPCIIDDRWPLLAIWTRHANSPNFRYIGQLWKYIQLHKSFLKSAGSLAVGDFNSNRIWDEWDRWWNHSDVVRELYELRLRSCYHEYFKEEQGAETRATFYLHRNLQKRYHIDYAFAERSWSLVHVEVGSHDDWINDSDHMPLMTHLQLT
jgi:endonuclease/exonuclease/phosphatase family metal-dependent hydrolase